MSDVYSGLTFQALRCVASSVEGKPLDMPEQKSEYGPVPDANKQIQVERSASNRQSLEWIIRFRYAAR
jgi:hypothetical protein